VLDITRISIGMCIVNRNVIEINDLECDIVSKLLKSLCLQMIEFF